MQKMMQHDKINGRIKERRNINEFSREGAGLKIKKQYNKCLPPVEWILNVFLLLVLLNWFQLWYGHISNE